jgi:hypothetical protein
MRIGASNGTAQVATAPAARRGVAASFSVGEEAVVRSPSVPGGPRAVGGIDALIALQGIEDPLERRRHAVKRGRLALDALDELKLGLLGGTLSSAMLIKLKAAAGHLKQGSGDADLDTVLSEIELRVEVEIAKIAPR